MKRTKLIRVQRMHIFTANLNDANSIKIAERKKFNCECKGLNLIQTISNINKVTFIYQ